MRGKERGRQRRPRSFVIVRLRRSAAIRLFLRAVGADAHIGTPLQARRGDSRIARPVFINRAKERCDPDAEEPRGIQNNIDAHAFADDPAFQPAQGAG